MWISKEKYQALVTGQRTLADRLKEVADDVLNLKRFFDDVTKNIGERIAELEESYKRGSLKSDEPESVQIDPGHVPFTQRKRNLEAAFRAKAEAKRKPPSAAKGT